MFSITSKYDLYIVETMYSTWVEHPYARTIMFSPTEFELTTFLYFNGNAIYVFWNRISVKSINWILIKNIFFEVGTISAYRQIYKIMQSIILVL